MIAQDTPLQGGSEVGTECPCKACRAGASTACGGGPSSSASSGSGGKQPAALT